MICSSLSGYYKAPSFFKSPKAQMKCNSKKQQKKATSEYITYGKYFLEFFWKMCCFSSIAPSFQSFTIIIFRKNYANKT